MKLTVIKAHTPENAFDGYDPHRHWELINMPVADYLNRVVAKGLVYPGKEMASVILSPWQLPWIRNNVVLVGYDFLELVEPKYYGLYAFGNLHDGIDGQLIEDGPGTFVQTVESGYTNIAGRHATADIYEVEVDFILEPWQSKQGITGINYLTQAGVISDPLRWKHSLIEPVPQWLFWSIIQRIQEGK